MDPRKRRRTAASSASGDEPLQIIGGHFGGRRLQYHGRPGTRPMKHRVREAIFNLIGEEVRGRHAIDLFAGTGATGLEALSRGAAGATFIEQHIPTSQLLRENVERLDVSRQISLLSTSVFLWVKRDLPDFVPDCDTTPFAPRGRQRRQRRVQEDPRPDGSAWIVFCSPPYDFYISRRAEMVDLAGRLADHAPRNSLLVFESDQRFELEELGLSPLDVRHYPPASIGIVRLGI